MKQERRPVLVIGGIIEWNDIRAVAKRFDCDPDDSVFKEVYERFAEEMIKTAGIKEFLGIFFGKALKLAREENEGNGIEES